MLWSTVVFHQVAIGMTVYFGSAGQQIAADDGHLYTQAMQEVLHPLVEPPIGCNAELHEIRVPGR